MYHVLSRTITDSLQIRPCALFAMDSVVVHKWPREKGFITKTVRDINRTMRENPTKVYTNTSNRIDKAVGDFNRIRFVINSFSRGPNHNKGLN